MSLNTEYTQAHFEVHCNEKPGKYKQLTMKLKTKYCTPSRPIRGATSTAGEGHQGQSCNNVRAPPDSSQLQEVLTILLI